MAIIKFTNSKSNLKTIINYVTRKDKINENLITGKDCIASSSLEEMLAIKKLYNKTDGRQYIHLVQSFSPKDNITPQQAHLIGVELAKYFTGFQVLVATHTDKEHLHNHLILNSVNFENGKKFNQSKQEMQKVKDYSDKLCKSAGLGIIKKKQYAGIYKKNEYQVAIKGKSCKIRLMNAIDYAIANSKTKSDYFKQINKLGYSVTWTQNRKYITYTTPEGYKCRDNKLNNPKYLKGEMENAFNGRNKENEQSGNTTKTGDYTTTYHAELCIDESRTNGANNKMEQNSNTKRKRHQTFATNGQSRYGQNGKKFTRKIDTNCKTRDYRQDERYDKQGEKLQQTKFDIQDKSSNNRNFSRDYNRSYHQSVTLMAINLLASMSRPREQNKYLPKKKIKGWKHMSKQEKREWYFKHRFSSSFHWEDEMEM